MGEVSQYYGKEEIGRTEGRKDGRKEVGKEGAKECNCTGS